ncbi:MAG TPA: hypothetical protein VHY37_04495, partial [Tepidisphaeraceae bacterium]|nr:hypothetical protein [Tepidisphaeraceae bacterium]
LRSLLKGNDEDKVERIRNLIIPSPSVQYAAKKSRMLIDRARAAISDLPESQEKQILDTLAEFVISRPM